MRNPVLRALGALLVPALLLSACTVEDGAQGPAGRSRPDPRFSSYVALGDSYTAGPLVPTTDLANGCLRSDHNYPSLLAKRLRLPHFTDVSCSGATTGDITHRQNTYREAYVPPQLRAVREDTDLVTVGIGGNDYGLFATLAQTCTRLRATDPTGSPCTASLAGGQSLTQTTRRIGDHVERVLREVRQTAPRATVVLVGYLRVVPDHGRCPQLPLATGDYALGRRITKELDAALARAAARAQVGYLDAYALSAGHDVCADRPWVNGGRTDRQRAAAFHPLGSGMRAVADRLVTMLS
jgi:lysophospholipase L1-like esterase